MAVFCGMRTIQYSARSPRLSLKLCKWVWPKITIVVKVMWRKAHRLRRQMVQSYSPRGGNVSSHEGTFGATLRIWLNLCVIRPTRVHNPNGKSTATAVFARLTAESSHTLQSRAPLSHKIVPFPCVYTVHPHVTHDSQGPSEPITQTASRPLQPFMHRWPQSALIFYSGLPLSPSELSFSTGIWTPSNTWFLGPTRFLNPNGISIASAVFAGLDH